MAAHLDVDAAVLGRLLSFFPGAFPGAVRDEVHVWVVPSTTLTALRRPRVGIELVQEATVAEVAAAIRKSPQTVWRWCQPGPGGEVPVLKSRKAAGSVLIEVRSVLALPARLPDWLAEGVKQRRKGYGGGKVSPKGAARLGAGGEGLGEMGEAGSNHSRCTALDSDSLVNKEL